MVSPLLLVFFGDTEWKLITLLNRPLLLFQVLA
jgi:hypothetical protein